MSYNDCHTNIDPYIRWMSQKMFFLKGGLCTNKRWETLLYTIIKHKCLLYLHVSKLKNTYLKPTTKVIKN